METAYLICAAIGGTLIVCQFLMTLFGLSGGHELGGGDHVEVPGHDAGGDAGGGDADGGDHHGDHGDESTWFLGLLTFRTISAGLAFFGLVGIIGQRQPLDEIVTLALAIGAGLAALFLVGWIMKLLGKLNADGTVRIERSVGCSGTVYVSIPADHARLGKVQISIMNRTMEYKATAKKPLAPGAKVVVVAVIGSDTVEVEPEGES